MVANANNIVQDQLRATEQQPQEEQSQEEEELELDLGDLFGDESVEQKQPQENSPYFGGSDLADYDSEEEKAERRVRFEQVQDEGDNYSDENFEDDDTLLGFSL